MTVSMSCSIATFKRYSASGRAAPSAAIEELYTEDCVVYAPPGRFVGRNI